MPVVLSLTFWICFYLHPVKKTKKWGIESEILYIFNISYIKLHFGNSEIVMNATIKDNFAGLENK